MSRPRLSFTPALAACLLALVWHAAHAQEPAPAAPAQASAPARVSFIVTGKDSQPAGELRREELRVTVGGVEQSVSALTRDESPLSFGLVVDNSGSLRSQFGAVAAAAKHIAANVRPGDEGFVVRFVSSDNIKLLQDFTTDTASLAAALDRMTTEGGKTAIVDALHFTAERFARPGPRRRALVLITDGEDRASSHKLEQLLPKLQQGEIRVYCIGLTGELDREEGFINKSRRRRAEEFLTRVAEETGGRVFLVRKPEGLLDAVLQITSLLRSEYVVEFVPAGKQGAPAGGKVEIKLLDTGKSGRAVVHRPLKMKAGSVSH